MSTSKTARFWPTTRGLRQITRFSCRLRRHLGSRLRKIFSFGVGWVTYHIWLVTHSTHPTEPIDLSYYYSQPKYPKSQNTQCLSVKTLYWISLVISIFGTLALGICDFGLGCFGIMGILALGIQGLGTLGWNRKFPSPSTELFLKWINTRKNGSLN